MFGTTGDVGPKTKKIAYSYVDREVDDTETKAEFESNNKKANRGCRAVL